MAADVSRKRRRRRRSDDARRRRRSDPVGLPSRVCEQLMRETGIGRAGIRALASQVRKDLHANIVLARKAADNHSGYDADSIKLMALAFVAAAKAKIV
jgi:hypothetical protein